jgi:hypothetical protein
MRYVPFPFRFLPEHLWNTNPFPWMTVARYRHEFSIRPSSGSPSDSSVHHQDPGDLSLKLYPPGFTHDHLCSVPGDSLLRLFYSTQHLCAHLSIHCGSFPSFGYAPKKCPMSPVFHLHNWLLNRSSPLIAAPRSRHFAFVYGFTNLAAARLIESGLADYPIAIHSIPSQKYRILNQLDVIHIHTQHTHT